MKKTIEILTLAFVLLLLNGCEGEKIEKPDQGSDNVPENPIPEGGEEDDSTPEDDRQTQTKGPVTLTLGEVTSTTVKFDAHLDVEMMADYQEVGLIYSTVSEMDVESEAVIKVRITKENYSEILTNLSYNTDYYYTIYLLKNNVYQYGVTQAFKTNDITISIDDVAVTATTVTFTGKVVGDALASDVKVGIAYGTSESKLTNVDVTPDTDGNYTLSLENLKYDTEYKYQTYVCQNGEYVYGDICTFSTSDITISVDDVAVTATTVTFTGKVARDARDSAVRVGIAYGISSSSLNRLDVNPDEKGNYTLTIDGLTDGKTYTYKTFVYQSAYQYGESNSFIFGLYEFQSNLNHSLATDLSLSASANCYIVSEAGIYKFKTVKGNSSTSIDSVKSAAILWETFGTSTSPEMCDLISAFCYKDGYIAFKTADTFKEGNAVIAAKGASGEILWSWHIWLTDQPQEQVYYNNAGAMMDRNLGAISATPGDVGALGLLYQWGRKDPFLGSSSISSSTPAKSTITWPSAVSTNSSRGTISYVRANPTTFITNNSGDYDWYYTGTSSTGNTRWTTSETAKSIYDPCPPGWRVPDGVWSKAIGSSYRFDYTYNNANEGMNFSGKFGSASTIWYPASGSRNYYDGSLYDVGNGGTYWSAYTSGDDSFSPAFLLRFSDDGVVNPFNYNWRAVGRSVRCIRELK